jgi:hypothetical protein
MMASLTCMVSWFDMNDMIWYEWRDIKGQGSTWFDENDMNGMIQAINKNDFKKTARGMVGGHLPVCYQLSYKLSQKVTLVSLPWAKFVLLHIL